MHYNTSSHHEVSTSKHQPQKETSLPKSNVSKTVTKKPHK